MRARFLSLCVFLIGCQSPDVTPVRADITAAATVICAPAVARPPPFTKTRDVTAPEIEAAIVSLCQAPTDAALDTIHEGLAQDQPIVALTHKNRMLLEAPKLDFTSMKAMDTVDKAAGTTCKKTWPGLGRALISSADKLAKDSPAQALGRCLDAIALARDTDLVGDALDSLLANSDIQATVMNCSSIAQGAPPEVAAAFARGVMRLRDTFPPTLSDVFKRDVAETTVFNFGPLRDPAQTLPCSLATDLSKSMGDMPAARSDQQKLVEAWKHAKDAPPADTKKYEEAYGLSLQTLQKLIEHAMKAR